ncbi:MAG: hypothetical protein V6Z82_04800 [Flavobacteriales bacterium]
MKRSDKAALERYQKKLEFARSSGLNPYESHSDRAQAIARAKSDFAFMIRRYFSNYATAETPDFHIRLARKAGRNPAYKGLIVWGRALAKSVVCDLFLPFWFWLRGEPIYHVIIGNNADRAVQLLENLRAEFEANPQILRDFGEQINAGSWEDKLFVTRGGFIGQGLGMGQSVRGLRVREKRPTNIVCDDIETKELLANPARMLKMKKWIERDLIPTMDGRFRRYFHANNHSADKMILTLLKDSRTGWDWNRVDAYDPITYEPTWAKKYTPDYFKAIEVDIGILAAQSEYNNAPHVEGEIFKSEDIRRVKSPKRSDFKVICGYWDVAYAATATADYNAVVVQGLYKGDFYVLDLFVRQCKMRDALVFMCDYQKRLTPSVCVHWLFESQFWNDEVRRTIKEVEREQKVQLNLIQVDRPTQSKYNRLLKLVPYYQNGRVFYNEKLEGKNDLHIGLSQLFGIEPGYKGHDDFPDAQKGGIDFLEKHIESDTEGNFQFRAGKMKPVHNW